MTETDRLVVAGFVLFLLGASFLVFLLEFAVTYVLPGVVLYVAFGAALLWRILQAG